MFGEHNNKSYLYHIIPSPSLTGISFWNQVVNLSSELRLAKVPMKTLLDPLIDKETIEQKINTTEIYSHEEELWKEAFIWSRNYITILIPFLPGDELCPNWRIVSKLTQKLDARLVGQNGEEYQREMGYVCVDSTGKAVLSDFDEKLLAKIA